MDWQDGLDSDIALICNNHLDIFFHPFLFRTTPSKTTRNIRQNSSPQCLIPLPSTWVTLLEPPIYSCYDEALLMCQYPDGHWAAWIPDFGGIKLYSGQFCRMN
ncbi:MAG: hypothetical protein ACK6CP_18020 [Pseudanabaena sp.]|jgi:hypothetical protein|nr:hypothetical protein [Chitinophagaceae bacterium]MCA6519749.1 hypothetical protein [Pseudanabaena sp. M110S1SP2A07QC]MCA6521548.1 hypothetical protein [Pseudanabaena sp. M051S1SP2A07QC]MCA6525311.1 hypothetical protein [Pseudanabaena sp. M179S2SP2A07QC]MCA6528428.1 hypothetical protein [Pseudanabaena sp. M125S2SP2A07QC]MCA6533711.1 hypothetical protein [Pseudanabaena sp. M176S2SP2A07QC]MCA6542570.1 hypothetical protein [Pseudanabaena sp. M074S1SP2A07QC]MCA6547042.1 hypothetical protein [P